MPFAFCGPGEARDSPRPDVRAEVQILTNLEWYLVEDPGGVAAVGGSFSMPVAMHDALDGLGTNMLMKYSVYRARIPPARHS